jgi:hypothetical protein
MHILEGVRALRTLIDKESPEDGSTPYHNCRAMGNMTRLTFKTKENAQKLANRDAAGRLSLSMLTLTGCLLDGS